MKLQTWDSENADLPGSFKGADVYRGYKTRTIASKYMNVAKAFFESKNMDINLVKIEGSVELAPVLGLADALWIL